MGKSGSKLSSLDRIRYQHRQTSLRNPKTSGTARGEAKNLRKGLSLDQYMLNNLLDDDVSLANFLTETFYNEVEITDSMQTLFRGNCMASKIMSHCFRTFGSGYLKQLLEPHIRPLVPPTDTNHDGCLDQHQQQSREKQKYNLEDISYEIDAARLEGDGNIDLNQQNLLKLTRQILNSILQSSKEFPSQLNLMCVCLRQVLREKYPNSDTYLKAIGTVIFLRFINPAIVSPYEAGIVDCQPSQKVLRGLMLVSKILQNIANNVEFSKEEHMLPFNSFVQTQFEPMRQWVSEISSERGQGVATTSTD